MNEVAKIYYDKKLDALFLEYISKVPGDDYFNKLNVALLDAFRMLKTQKMVADIRKMGMISVASQKLIAEMVLPEMMKHLGSRKLYHAQLVDNKDIMAKVSGTNIKNKTKDITVGFEVVQFSDRAELEKYLLSI